MDYASELQTIVDTAVSLAESAKRLQEAIGRNKRRGGPRDGRPSTRHKLRQMKVGEVIRVPVNEIGYTSIRNAASTLALETGQTYSVHLERKEKMYEITRTS
jgi:TusA-related sulfurtransferase